MSPHGFSALPLLEVSEPLAAALRAAGVEQPNAAQVAAIPAILAGANVLVCSGTGTGKTLAYALPVLQRLVADPTLRAVVFTPGAELAMQCLSVFDALKPADLSSGAAVSTTSHRRQRARVQRSTRLVVGTADRLLELFRAGHLKGVRLIVLDEIEAILRARDVVFLYELLSRSTPVVQLVVATATLGPESRVFVERFLGPDRVDVVPAEQPLVDVIAHHVVRVPRAAAPDVTLLRFVQEQRCKQAIVFVSDPRLQAHLYYFLEEHGVPTVTVSEDRTKAQRQRGLDAFRDGRARLLLTTDYTARGLDVRGVAWVLHYDVPRTPEAYVHRAGRTGRAGEPGSSVLFVDDASRGAAKWLERALGIEFTPIPWR